MYRRVFQRRFDDRTQDVVDALRAVPAFQHVSSSALFAMAESVHRRTYRRGEVLYYEGDPGLGLYVVEKGRIRLTTAVEPGITRELRQIGPEQTFGVLSILGDFRRLESAETVTEASVLGFFRPDLKNLMKRHPKAGAEITMALARTIAAQHVEYVHLVSERDGREAALQVQAEASQ